MKWRLISYGNKLMKVSDVTEKLQMGIIKLKRYGQDISVETLNC